MRLSIGTEGILGLRKLKTDAPPTTAYLMLGEKCINNCLFCAKARNSSSNEDLLSWVTWNKIEENVWAMIEEAFGKGKIQRACIQAVNTPEIFQELIMEIEKAKKYTKIPLCISGGINCIQDAEKLLGLGIDRITIAVDAVNPEIFKKIKGGNFHEKLALIEQCALKFPGKVGTHLIAGLGESEEEMVSMIQKMYDKGIHAALFAFTPIKGAFMQGMPQPPIGAYRKIQAAHYLIKNKIVRGEAFKFKDGKIKTFSLPDERIKKILTDGKAFLTSGCPGCNRPYYNERPKGVMYNYPRKMNREEIEKAINELGLEN